MAVIESAEVFITSPGRNFVTLKITTSDGVTGLGDATLNGRELVGRRIPDRAHRAAVDRSRPAEDRRHLAVPVPRRVLAARAGHHGGDRRRGRGAVGHQGQGRRHAGVPTARRRLAHRRAGVRPCIRFGSAVAVHLDPQPPRAGVQGDPGADRGARPRAGLRRGDRPASWAALRLRAGQTHDRAHRGDLGHPRLPAPRAHRVRRRTGGVRLRHPAAARRPPPDDAEPGRESSASRWSRTTCSGSRTARPARTRRRCAGCAHRPRPRWRSARSSTPCSTTRRSSPSS